MTTLKSSPAAAQALYRRQVVDRARIVRGRVEATPGAGLFRRIAAVENRLALLQFDQAARMMDQIDADLDRHHQAVVAADMAAAGQAQDQLLAERDVETFEYGSVRSRDGWIWLKSRKPQRLTADQSDTGDRFAALYRAASRDALSTSANDNGGQGKADSLDALAAARGKLAHIARHISDATGSGRLHGLLVDICGRGETLRALAGGDDRKASSLEADLKTALDMARVAFRTLPKDEAA